MSDRDAHYSAMIESDRARALVELQALAEQEPDSAEIHLLLGRTHQRRLDFVPCAAAARRVLELNPRSSEARHQLGFSLMVLGDYTGAVAAYDHAFSRNKSSAAGLTAAVLRHRMGELGLAKIGLEHLLSAMAPDAKDAAPTERALAALLRDSGRPLEADHHVHALLQRFKGQPVSVASYLFYREQALAFAEWLGLVDKSRLAQVLKRIAPSDHAHVPETFVLPADRDALLAFAAAAPPGTLLIAKPIRGSGGQGISIVDDARTIADREDVVVQRYVDRPYLVDGRKGHLRIYALITSAAPLRAYVYREGIVRFAPEAYDPAHLDEVSRHITNTALHHGHPGLVIGEDPEREDEGSIWSVSAVLRRVAEVGHDPEVVHDRIRRLVGWFLKGLEADGFFARQAAAGSPRSFGPKIIGFDILLDADAQPWLIEIQSSPAATGAPLVERINSDLFINAFRMAVGVLAHDGMSPERVTALMSDPGAIAEREAEIERANLGRFRPIWG